MIPCVPPAAATIELLLNLRLTVWAAADTMNWEGCLGRLRQWDDAGPELHEAAGVDVVFLGVEPER